MLLERRCPGCLRSARFVCEDCWARLAYWGDAAALLLYDELTRRIVLEAKNGGRRDLWRPLGRALAGSIPPDIRRGLDVVTWVPASVHKQRERGFDQGQLLARSVARSIGVPHLRLLRRLDHQSQTGRSRVERMIGPRLRARGRDLGRVLVVDDVRTTGASLDAAARALRARGAGQVTALALSAVAE